MKRLISSDWKVGGGWGWKHPTLTTRLIKQYLLLLLLLFAVVAQFVRLDRLFSHAANLQIIHQKIEETKTKQNRNPKLDYLQTESVFFN